MRKIEITYHRPILGAKTLVRYMPTSWNELSREQLITIAGLLHSGKNIYEFRIEVLKCLLSLKWAHVFLLRERLVDLYPFIKFLEADNDLTENKIDTIAASGLTLYGPIGNFETLTAAEWIDADSAYTDYLQTKDPKCLDKLVAVLFREKVKGVSLDALYYTGDYRTAYHDQAVKLRMRYLDKVDPRIKLAVLIWYQACRQEWEEVFERVFQGAKEDIENFGWQETIQKLSGSTFGSLQETERTAMYKLMLNMEITLKDEEIRKKHEKAQKRNAY